MLEYIIVVLLAVVIVEIPLLLFWGKASFKRFFGSGYATAINCMDGAVQGAVRKETKKRKKVAHVDMITQPGIVKVLAESSNHERVELIKEMLEISIVHHNSRFIAISAHDGCLGAPESKEWQMKYLAASKKVVKRMIRELNLEHLDIEIVLLWINEKRLPEEVLIRQDGSMDSHELVLN